MCKHNHLFFFLYWTGEFIKIIALPRACQNWMSKGKRLGPPPICLKRQYHVSSNFKVPIIEIDSIFRRGRHLQHSIKRQQNDNY